MAAKTADALRKLGKLTPALVRLGNLWLLGVLTAQLPGWTCAHCSSRAGRGVFMRMNQL